MEGGKLSKPENSANQSSTKLMWVETINLGAIIHTTTRTYNICKFQAKSQNTLGEVLWIGDQGVLENMPKHHVATQGDIWQIHVHVNN